MRTEIKPNEPLTAEGRELRLKARPSARFNSLRSPKTPEIHPHEYAMPHILDNANNLGYSESIVSNAITGLVAAGVQTNSIFYLYGYENGFNLPHLTNAVNVAGYICWGWHSSLGGSYPLDKVEWSGNSGWWIIRTEESFNGQRGGQFLMWFSSSAFGGTNYSSTPIGGPTYVNEPTAQATDNQILFN